MIGRALRTLAVDGLRAARALPVETARGALLIAQNPVTALGTGVGVLRSGVVPTFRPDLILRQLDSVRREGVSLAGRGGGRGRAATARPGDRGRREHANLGPVGRRRPPAGRRLRRSGRLRRRPGGPVVPQPRRVRHLLAGPGPAGRGRGPAQRRLRAGPVGAHRCGATNAVDRRRHRVRAADTARGCPGGDRLGRPGTGAFRRPRTDPADPRRPATSPAPRTAAG